MHICRCTLKEPLCGDRIIAVGGAKRNPRTGGNMHNQNHVVVAGNLFVGFASHHPLQDPVTAARLYISNFFVHRGLRLLLRSCAYPRLLSSRRQSGSSFDLLCPLPPLPFTNILMGQEDRWIHHHDLHGRKIQLRFLGLWIKRRHSGQFLHQPVRKSSFPLVERRADQCDGLA